MASSASSAGMRRTPRQARSQERVNRILDVAEALFIAEGYTATTTNAIATRAQVPIGSLYQFFPDKAAILQALALRYTEKLHQALLEFHQQANLELPLPLYVDQVINVTNRFFTAHPGYHAIFMEVQGTMPELGEIEATADAQLIQDFAEALSQRNPALTPEDCAAIAFVLVKTIGTLLWLALSQEDSFRDRLVAETKKLTLSYLQTYFAKAEGERQGAEGW
jgi:AcrR family transcriptional regulator